MTTDGAPPNKPFHLMTPGEKTAIRIAQNRLISERIAEKTSHKPPASSSADYTRATPAEHGKLGSVIRKVKS